MKFFRSKLSNNEDAEEDFKSQYFDAQETLSEEEEEEEEGETRGDVLHPIL